MGAGGGGALSAKDEISGAKVGFQVVAVQAGSPSQQAGLIPFFDFIVAVQGERVLAESPNLVVEKAKQLQEMRLGVYNSRFDTLREVILRPSNQCGGAGLLGIF